MTFVEIPEALPFSFNTALHKFKVREGTLKHAFRIEILGILESSGSKEWETVRSAVDFELYFPYVVILRHPTAHCNSMCTAGCHFLNDVGDG